MTVGGAAGALAWTKAVALNCDGVAHMHLQFTKKLVYLNIILNEVVKIISLNLDYDYVF